MPVIRERANSVHMLFTRRAKSLMIGSVLSFWFADKIRRIIVRCIVIGVVDIVIVRNRSVDVLPDFLMQPLDTILSVLSIGRVVHAVRASRAIWISPEFDASIDDDFNVCHVVTISS